MNRRLRWMSLVSIVLHLVILWVLPRPSFQSAPEYDVKSVRLQLEKTETDRPPTKEQSQQVQPNDRTINQPAKLSEDPSESRTETKPEETTERSTPDEKDDAQTSAESDESSPTPSREDATAVEPREPTSPAPDAEEPEEPTNDSTDEPQYGLLEKDNRFQSGLNNNASREPGSAHEDATRTAVDETIEPYRIVEPREPSDATDTRQEIVIREPSETRGDTENVSVPVMTISETTAEAPPLQPVAEGTPRETPPRQSDRRVLRNPLPEAPDWLERTGQDVRVILQYVIDPDGNVVDVTVTNSSGFPELDSLVTRKLAQWKFEPGERSERRLIVFRFNLKQEG